MQTRLQPSPFSDKDFLGNMELGAVQKYPKKTILFNEHDKYTGVYLIQNGNVKITKGKSDHQMLLWLATNTEMIGINSHNVNFNYEYSATTLTDSTGFFIPKKKFDKLIKNNFIIKNELLKALSKRINFLEYRAAGKQFESTKERFIKLLLDLSSQKQSRTNSKKALKIELSIPDMASLIDTTEYYLIKIVNELKAKRLLSTSNECFIITDFDVLNSLI